MYPAKFRYEAPTSLAEALEMLSVYGDECKILAGGQSLVPMLKLRFFSSKRRPIFSWASIATAVRSTPWR